MHVICAVEEAVVGRFVVFDVYDRRQIARFDVYVFKEKIGLLGSIVSERKKMICSAPPPFRDVRCAFADGVQCADGGLWY